MLLVWWLLAGNAMKSGGFQVAGLGFLRAVMGGVSYGFSGCWFGFLRL